MIVLYVSRLKGTTQIVKVRTVDDKSHVSTVSKPRRLTPCGFVTVK